jgi:predicted GH43/DUF377 family glycosyl hydrolase
MINVEKLGIILSPTQKEFENKTVSNPGIYQDGNTLHFLYSAMKEDNVYTIGYAKTEGPIEIIERHEQPLITGELDFEIKGVKNAKIVAIEDTYYITYTACNGFNLMSALASSKDLKHIIKHGVITPSINYKKYRRLIDQNSEKLCDKYYEHYKLYNQIGVASSKSLFIRDKEIVLFPKKINGKFVMLHHLFPSIQIVYFNVWKDLTLSFWEDYLKNLSDYIVLEPDVLFEGDCIGIGCPPIETKFGWLLIYQGVQITTKGKKYHAMAALFQIDQPEKIISRIPYPLFSPTEWWEKEGEINQSSVTPSGSAIFEDDLYIYYGASNKYIAVAKINLNELLTELVKEI